MTKAPTPLVIVSTLVVALLALPFAGLLADVPWTRLHDLVTDPTVTAALRVTAIVVPLATAAIIVLGTPLAWAMARYEGRWTTPVRVLVLVPVVLPPVVSGLVLLSAFGRRSLLGRVLESVGVVLPFSLGGTVLAAVFVALPFYVLAAEVGFRDIPTANLDAARTLGTSENRELLGVAIPHALPALAAGTLLAAARALGEFGATITFAGNVRGSTRTLPLATFTALEQDPDVARAIGLILVTIAVVVIFALRGALLPQRR